MSTIGPLSVSDARDQLASIINRAHRDHEPVFLSRRGRRVVAVIDADDLERLTELAEDMVDIRAAQQSREEMRRTQEEPTPWDLVKADLGLV
jgi:prevent-host-death family protein